MNFTGQLTPQGQALLAKVLTGGTVTVTKVLAGAGTTAQDAPALAEPRQTLAISARSADGSVGTLTVTLAASLAEEAYTLRELGVYAQDPDAGEILYQLYRLDDPVEIDPASRLVLRTYLRLAASDDLSLTLSLPPSGLLVEADVQNKADLVNGWVPVEQLPHLAAPQVFYVDGTGGNDANPGSQELPFRTIQAAIDALPKNLGGLYAAIKVLPGMYPDGFVLNGFYNGGRPFEEGITIKKEGSGSVVVQGYVGIYGMGCAVQLEELELQGRIDHQYCSGNLRLWYVSVDAASAEYGVGVRSFASAGLSMYHCSVSNASIAAVTVSHETAYICALSGSGNQVAVSAGDASHGGPGLAIVSQMNAGAESKYAKLYGGAIMEDGVMV